MICNVSYVDVIYGCHVHVIWQLLIIWLTMCCMLISFMVVVNLCIRFDNANFTVRIMSYVDVIYGCHVHDIW
jgi:hypothetical protein